MVRAGSVARPLRVTTRNATFQQWGALLTNRTTRNRSGQFLVQGVRPITMALQAGWPIHALLAADPSSGRPHSDWARRLWAQAGGSRALLAPDLLAELGEREGAEPPELVAVLDMPPDDLDRLVPAGMPHDGAGKDHDGAGKDTDRPIDRDPNRFVGPPAEPEGRLRAVRPEGWAPLLTVFDRPTNPGNIGTLARSLDAFGGTGLLVSGHAADPYDPRSVRASTGSLFAVPTVRVGSHRDVLDWIGAQRATGTTYTVVGTDETGSVPLRDADLTGPVVVVVGNETRGMTRAWREACDVVVAIPMLGTASSLNAATAGSLVLHEALQQRLASG